MNAAKLFSFCIHYVFYVSIFIIFKKHKPAKKKFATRNSLAAKFHALDTELFLKSIKGQECKAQILAETAEEPVHLGELPRMRT